MVKNRRLILLLIGTACMAMLIFFLPYLVFRPLLKNRNYDLISASCIEYNGSSYSFTAPGELDELKEKYLDVYIHGIRWCTAVKEWRYRMTVNYTGKNGEMISDAFYIDDMVFSRPYWYQAPGRSARRLNGENAGADGSGAVFSNLPAADHH